MGDTKRGGGGITKRGLVLGVIQRGVVAVTQRVVGVTQRGDVVRVTQRGVVLGVIQRGVVAVTQRGVGVTQRGVVVRVTQRGDGVTQRRVVEG